MFLLLMYTRNTFCCGSAAESGLCRVTHMQVIAFAPWSRFLLPRWWQHFVFFVIAICPIMMVSIGTVIVGFRTMHTTGFLRCILREEANFQDFCEVRNTSVDDISDCWFEEPGGKVFGDYPHHQ